MRFAPKQPANMQAMQARYDRLSGMNSRNPTQQARMDRLGARLNLAGGMGSDGQSTAVNSSGPRSPRNIDYRPVDNMYASPPRTGGGMGPPPGLASTMGAPMGGGMGSPMGGGMSASPMKKGGRVKGSATSSKGTISAPKASPTSKRGDGIAQRGKTKGKMC